MREYSVPAVVTVGPTENCTDAVFRNAAEEPDVVVFARRRDGVWQDVSAREFLEEVVAVAKGLVAAGVQAGDRVALMSKTRYEWTLCDYAIWVCGGVTVPVYETSSPEQVEWIMADSGVVAAFVETGDHAATVATVRDRLPHLREVWRLDNGAVATLSANGAHVADGLIEERRAGIGSSSLATVIYTSGTTGRPKGCELTHGNFVFDARNATGEGLRELFSSDASTLLFIPLAHVFARLIQVGCVENRVRMGHGPDAKNLLADLATFRPTFILSVPRVFEKVFNTARQKAHGEGKGRIFDAAAGTAIAYSEARDAGGVGIGLRLRHMLFDRLVYGKLRSALGGRVRYAVSGGAPLGARLGHFFRGIGVTVLEGYGLTETTAAATVNLPQALKIGTVGRPIPGGGVKIAEDGEVLLRGGHIFVGYWNNPAATEEVLDPDGWFHTGDLGELDADGFLRLTGRKKEIIVTAGGKNVAPAVLEDRLRSHYLISQCMVVGDQQPFIGSLITLDPDTLPGWAEEKGKAGRTAKELKDDPDLLAEIQQVVDDANKAVSKAEAIKKFRILDVDFTEAGGQLTPTLKLKRTVVLKDFGQEIEALYS
ncbi:MAG: AMP-dependent synthetase/ligase [Mycobacterium leprae]